MVIIAADITYVVNQNIEDTTILSGSIELNTTEILQSYIIKAINE